MVIASVEVKESDSGGRGSNLSDVFELIKKKSRPAYHSQAIFPTLVGLCLVFLVLEVN